MDPKVRVIPKVSIILIRDAAEQMTGSGCCGRLEGDNGMTGSTAAFREVRRQQAAMGILHRTITEFFAEQCLSRELEIVTVDPRNQPYLIPKLVKDVCRYRPGLFGGLFTMLQFFSLPAVIVNGCVLSCRGGRLDPDTLCHAVARLLSEGNPQSTLQIPS